MRMSVAFQDLRAIIWQIGMAWPHDGAANTMQTVSDEPHCPQLFVLENNSFPEPSNRFHYNSRRSTRRQTNMQTIKCVVVGDGAVGKVGSVCPVQRVASLGQLMRPPVRPASSSRIPPTNSLVNTSQLWVHRRRVESSFMCGLPRFSNRYSTITL